MNRLDLFKDKKILITGHTGFKGSWLTIWLKNLGGKILGISLRPQTLPSNYYDCEISKNIKTVFIPLENKKDLTEIPKKLVKGLKIVTVSNVDDVLKHSLTKKISPIDWSKIPVSEKKSTSSELIV